MHYWWDKIQIAELQQRENLRTKQRNATGISNIGDGQQSIKVTTNLTDSDSRKDHCRAGLAISSQHDSLQSQRWSVNGKKWILLCLVLLHVETSKILLQTQETSYIM